MKEPVRGARGAWTVFGGWVVVVTGAGAVFGLIRGMDYLPTLPFALIEGALIFGIPASAIGLLLLGLWYGVGAALAHVVRRPSHE
jgi:hypothetical protein